MVELFYRELVNAIPARESMALKIYEMHAEAIQSELDCRLEEDIMTLGCTMDHSNRAFILQSCRVHNLSQVSVHAVSVSSVCDIVSSES